MRILLRDDVQDGTASRRSQAAGAHGGGITGRGDVSVGDRNEQDGKRVRERGRARPRYASPGVLTVAHGGRLSELLAVQPSDDPAASIRQRAWSHWGI